MKLWKKLLIGVLVLVALGIGIVGYGLFKMQKLYTEKIAPDMVRYTQMTSAEQDKYIVSRMEDLTMMIAGDDKDGTGKAVVEAMEKDPALRQAGIVWGRAICASIIKDNDDLSSRLTPAQKEQYKKEAEDLDDKSEHFQNMMRKAGLLKK
jgi:hypothetical protein